MKPLCIVMVLIIITLVVVLIVKAKKCAQTKEVTETPKTVTEQSSPRPSNMTR